MVAGTVKLIIINIVHTVKFKAGQIFVRRRSIAKKYHRIEQNNIYTYSQKFPCGGVKNTSTVGKLVKIKNVLQYKYKLVR